MSSVVRISMLLACIAMLAVATDAGAQGLQSRLDAAMAAAERPQADKDIDALRKPVEVLRFLGIDAGMSVLDVTAATGYYTELLSAAVGPGGRVYAQNDEGTLTRRDGAVDKALSARIGNRLTNVERIDTGADQMSLRGEVDAALVVLTIHDAYNFQGEDAALAVLRGVYAALKPGGTVGFIDHNGVAGQDNRTLHRIEKSVAEQLLRDAGFVIEAESDVLANAGDDHTLGVFDPSIRRRTDRFVIRATKSGG